MLKFYQGLKRKYLELHDDVDGQQEHNQSLSPGKLTAFECTMIFAITEYYDRHKNELNGQLKFDLTEY